MTTETAQRRGDAAVLRRVWRMHFWVGLFAAPALVVLALSGLVILYSQPLDRWLHGDLTTVEQGAQQVSLDEQVATAQQHVPADYALDGVIPPAGAGLSTRVDFVAPDAPGYPAAESDVTQVFVDPYTGEYLGQRNQLSGLVGFANQVHRMFGNDGPQVHLPSLGHLINPSAYPEATIPVGIGNLWMELTAVWILVLMGTGLYLWWPRAIESTKPLWRIRWGRGGRIRWRDLHALTGVVLAVVVICYILSGLTWSRYWGENWRAFSAAVTPSAEVDAPSTPATMGDHDRMGRRIAWAATDDPVYASAPGPAPLGYADIDRIAKDEGMVPGYAIIPPSDSVSDGQPVFGSYAVVNAWPQRLSEQRTLYLDQFSGQTITNATSAEDGALSRATSFGIAMHMGNQWGLLTRIIATLACLGILASIGTALAMWWKRRPAGGAGLPAPAGPGIRAATPQRAKVVVGILAVGLSVLFPVFGASLLLVLAVEVFLRLRRDKAADAGEGPADPVQPEAGRLQDVAVDEAGDEEGDEVPVGVQR